MGGDGEITEECLPVPHPASFVVVYLSRLAVSLVVVVMEPAAFDLCSLTKPALLSVWVNIKDMKPLSFQELSMFSVSLLSQPTRTNTQKVHKIFMKWVIPSC